MHCSIERANQNCLVSITWPENKGESNWLGSKAGAAVEIKVGTEAEIAIKSRKKTGVAIRVAGCLAKLLNQITWSGCSIRLLSQVAQLNKLNKIGRNS